MVEHSMRYINAYGPEVARILELEMMRQRNNLELIASENLVSPEVMAVMGSVLTNKYAEGYCCSSFLFIFYNKKAPRK